MALHACSGLHSSLREQKYRAVTVMSFQRTRRSDMLVVVGGREGGGGGCGGEFFKGSRM